MEEKQKRATAAWVTGTLILLLVLYPASFWLAIRINRSRAAVNERMLTAYLPIVWVLPYLPHWTQFAAVRCISSAGGDRSLHVSNTEIYFVD